MEVNDNNGKPRPEGFENWLTTLGGPLLEKTVDAVFVADIECETLVYVNQAAEQLMGRKKDDLLGMAITRLHPPETVDYVVEQFRSMTRGDCFFSRDIPVQRADGSVVLTDVQSMPLEVGGRQCMLGLFRDVSDRAGAQRRAREAEDRFKLAIKSLPMGLHMYRLEPDGDLIFIGANPAADSILQVDNSTFIGKRLEEAFPLLRDSELPDVYRRVARNDGVWHRDDIEYNAGPIRGVFEVVAFQIKPNEMAAMFWDITERKKVQAEMQRFTAAVHGVAESVVITNPEGVIVYVNKFFETTTGYSLDEVKGKPIGSLKSGRHDSGFYEKIWQRIRAGRSWSGSFINRRKDGSLFEEEATISPVFDSERRIVNYVGVRRDMTKELDLERRMVQSQKMVALGQLAHRIAHDITNSLCTILGRATLLERSAHNADTKALAAGIVAATEQISDLTGSLMTFASPDTLSLQRCSASRVVKTLESMIRRVCGNGVEVTFTTEDDVYVKVDVSQLEQAVMHLVVNAVEAMDGTGQLTIRVAGGTMPEPDGTLPADLFHLQESPAVCIAVQDTGCGMSDEACKRAFEPFYTTKRDIRKNAGLGLATVYGIVAAHGGDVVIDSVEGEGAQVVIRLPAAE